MAIDIGITKQELASMGRMLAKKQDIHCLDSASYVKLTLVAQRRLLRSQKVEAKIIAPGVK